MAACGLILAKTHLAVERPLVPSWSIVREVGRYASRMQLVAMTGFVNAELDGFVIAAVSPVRYVGLYNIGLKAASAARSVPLCAFSPLLTRLTTTFRREGRAAAAVEFEYLERRWFPSVLGYGVLALSAIGFSVTIWLGDDYVLSGVTAVVLLTGYIVYVGLTGMRTCYVRAIGRPGLEARYSTVWTVCNAALTVPLALAAGMIGVVSATAATGIVASVYFVLLCRWAERLPFYLPRRAVVDRGRRRGHLDGTWRGRRTPHGHRRLRRVGGLRDPAARRVGDRRSLRARAVSILGHDAPALHAHVIPGPTPRSRSAS
jgi:O-antigen/teichoic acid export membrane protein